MHPFLASALRPRAGLRAALAQPTERATYLIGALGGAVIAVDLAQVLALGDLYALAPLVLGAIIAGALLGVLRLWAGGWLFALTGSWFRGQGKAREVRAAIAWSCTPSLWVAPLWAVALLLFGRDALTTASSADAPVAGMEAAAMIAWVVLRAGAALWSFGVWLEQYAEAHGFALWRAAAAWASGALVFVGVAAAVGAPAALLLTG